MGGLAGACGATTELGVGERTAKGGSSGWAGAGSAGAGAQVGAPVPWTACADSSECVLEARTCCGGCELYGVADSVAVNLAYANELRQRLCSNDGACTPCMPQSNFLVAVCRAGQCQPVDIRDDVLTACSSAADCSYRWGVGCCEACGGDSDTELITVNAVNFTTEVCGARPETCAPCTRRPYPAGWVLRCTAEHCTKARVL